MWAAGPRTLQAWAALEYLDDQLGRLFAFLQASGLSKTTYVMVMSDNGAALLPDERKQAWVSAAPVC